MASKNQSITPKVRNTKATLKTGKNQQAESLMKRSFEPLLSAKDNKARLTFCGVEHSIIEWTDKGKHREKPVMKLVFSCLDTTHEAPINIGVTCEYRVSEKNRLGQIIKMMGFEFADETEIVDEDDEFGARKVQSDGSEIFTFLRGQCGLVFKGNLKPATRKNKTTGERYQAYGLWEIEYQTLEPKLTKNGEQERDMLASDITDEDFQNPEIAMASETD